MATYSANVVRYFREKDASGGFLPAVSWLGAEQRFVGPLRNSNVNNLEEQYLLGTDVYTSFDEDSEGNEIITKCFCRMNSGSIVTETEYYKIITTKYKTPIPGGEFTFTTNSLIIDGGEVDAHFGDGSASYPNLENIYLSDEVYYEFSDDEMIMHPQLFSTIQQDELYFVKIGTPDLLVAIKITGLRYDNDGKKFTKERIINNLS